jgi:hypothetical protein
MKRYDTPSPARDDIPALEHGVRSDLILPALPSAAFCARRYARTVLRGWYLDETAACTVELLVSELVTNAVRCCSPSAGRSPRAEPGDLKRILLTLRYLPRHLIAEVSDPDPNPPILTEADPEAERGRGLMLVDALSTDWNYFRRPSGGKTVFCVVELVPSFSWRDRAYQSTEPGEKAGE